MELNLSKKFFLTTLLTSCYALAQNIVVNGNFTSYDGSYYPNNWNLSGDTLFTGVDTSITPPNGGYALEFGSISNNDNIWTQTLSTTPGKTYTLSFYLKNVGVSNDTPPNDFSATFGSTTALSLSDQDAFDWTFYNSTVTASATTTDLVFAGRNYTNYYCLGNVSVVPTISSNQNSTSTALTPATAQVVSITQMNSLFLRKSQSFNQKFQKTSTTKTAANSLLDEESLIAANTSEMLRKTRQLEKKSEESQKPWSVYVGPVGSYGQIDMPHNPKTTYGSGGALTGFDYAFQNVGSFPFYIGLGTALEYRYLFGHIHQNTGSFDSQRINLTIYNSYVPKKVNDLNINLLLGYAYCFDAMHRKTGINKSETAIANTHEQLFNGVLDFEYTVKHEFASKFKQSISWVPFANIQYIYDAINNYKEKNAGIYNIKYNLPNLQSLLSSLGSRFSYAKSTQSLDFTAELDFTWQRQYLAKNNHFSYLAFNSSSTPGIATINGLSRNQYLLGLDLLFKIYNKVSIEASCDLLWSSRVFDSNFYLGIGSDF